MYEEYYKNALKEMKQMIDNPTFFFFSDDIEWVKNTFGTSEDIFMQTVETDGKIIMICSLCQNVSI